MTKRCLAQEGEARVDEALHRLLSDGEIGEGKLKVRVDRTFPLAEATQAQIYLSSRAARGKVLLIP